MASFAKTIGCDDYNALRDTEDPFPLIGCAQCRDAIRLFCDPDGGQIWGNTTFNFPIRYRVGLIKYHLFDDVKFCLSLGLRCMDFSQDGASINTLLISKPIFESSVLALHNLRFSKHCSFEKCPLSVVYVIHWIMIS